MLDRQLVIGTRDRALQQAPDVFNAVGMDVATNVFFGAMVDDLMLRIMVPNAPVGLPIIGDDDFGIICRILLDEAMQRLPIRPVDDLQPDFTTSLNHADDYALILQIGPLTTSSSFHFSSDESFINLKE